MNTAEIQIAWLPVDGIGLNFEATHCVRQVNLKQIYPWWVVGILVQRRCISQHYC